MKNTFTLKLDLRMICIFLSVVIIIMFGLWKPWDSASNTVRKITISGEATVKGIPDEFAFYPSFSRTGTDTTAMKNELNKFGIKLQSDIEKLGVNNNHIVLDSSSYNNYPQSTSMPASEETVTLQVTITVFDKKIAQKVQDYLASTNAMGQLTAQSVFSTTKQKELESSARQLAIKDARKKATLAASDVGARLGKVIEVTDQSSFSGGCGAKGICPISMSAKAYSEDVNTSLPVTPGLSEVSSTVEVVYQLL